MSEQIETFSELVEISKLNGNFKRNYGKLLGAFLYLRSMSASRGRSSFWVGFWFAAFSAGMAWFDRLFLSALTSRLGNGGLF